MQYLLNCKFVINVFYVYKCKGYISKCLPYNCTKNANAINNDEKTKITWRYLEAM